MTCSEKKKGEENHAGTAIADIASSGSARLGLFAGFFACHTKTLCSLFSSSHRLCCLLVFLTLKLKINKNLNKNLNLTKSHFIKTIAKKIPELFYSMVVTCVSLNVGLEVSCLYPPNLPKYRRSPKPDSSTSTT